LKPGGRFIFNVWDRIEENEFAHIITETASEVFPDDPPVFLARTPHGYHDTDQIVNDLKAAGFTEINNIVLEKESIGSSASHPAIAYCQGTPLRAEIVTRNADLLDYVTDQATKAIQSRFGEEGPVTGKIKGYIIEATF